MNFVFLADAFFGAEAEVVFGEGELLGVALVCFGFAFLSRLLAVVVVSRLACSRACIRSMCSSTAGASFLLVSSPGAVVTF